MAFYIGQKVTRVCDGMLHNFRGESVNDPPYGTVVTVRDVEEALGHHIVTLVEVPAWTYHHTCFRPVTDIGVFEKMLDVRKCEAVEP